MKIKLDENLGVRGKEILSDAGFDVTTVPDQNMCSVSDDDLINACGREERVLVTLDKDFSNTTVYKPASYSGIAVIRLSNKSTDYELYNCVKLLGRALQQQNIAGKLWIIQEKSVRFYNFDNDEPDWFVGDNVIEYST
jgi:predicted nuclease of predicted toxin-antitoxin system